MQRGRWVLENLIDMVMQRRNLCEEMLAVSTRQAELASGQEYDDELLRLYGQMLIYRGSLVQEINRLNEMLDECHSKGGVDEDAGRIESIEGETLDILRKIQKQDLNTIKTLAETRGKIGQKIKAYQVEKKAVNMYLGDASSLEGYFFDKRK